MHELLSNSPFEETFLIQENNEKKMENCDEISKLIKAFPKDIVQNPFCKIMPLWQRF